MHKFEETKRQILDRVDILDLVSESVSLKRSGQRWVGLCPFHAEKTPSFTVRPEHGMFKCFGCGKGGDLFSFVQFMENVSFIEAMNMLADRAGVDRHEPSGRGDSSGVGRADLARVNAWASDFFRSQLLDDRVGKDAREYVCRRRIHDATAERFHLGLAVESGAGIQAAAARAGIDDALLIAADLLRRNERGQLYNTFHNRLIFPIRDATNRVIGFGGRTLADDRAKYINTRQTLLFEKGRSLYGIDLARNGAKQDGRMIVVEGYTDCMAAHQAGFSQTVATLGTALTESQVDLIRRYCDQVVFLFDSDQAGEAAAERAIHVAVPRCVKVRLARIPEGKDPCDFLHQQTAEAFSDLLNQAVDALEFKWLETQRRFEAHGSTASRREAVRDFLSLIAKATRTRAVDAIDRGMLVNQVAHLLRMDRQDVNRLLHRFASQKQTRVAPRGGCAANVSRAIPADAEQANWAHVLEVLLNEPGLLTTIRDVPDVARISDNRDRLIARTLIELAEAKRAFGLKDVLLRLDDPADVERVRELACRGRERGNYGNTLRLALERIHRAVENEAVECSKQSWVSDGRESEPLEPSSEELALFSEGVRNHHGFAPRRLIRRAVDSET